MSLGLAHSLGRHKLKFSADKVDIMIVQAIGLLDDLDKELNTYAMRVKEWFGWHFPEMAKIVQDNIAYARVIKLMGFRSRASETDFSSVLPEEIEQALKAAAEVSMGTEITQFDLDNINALADQVVDFSEYREQLSNYLNARMAAIAPNLTALVGELVGARLIAHAGSLISLAKAPASTIQILGAEKALFRALKTKHDTPKYGIIYHASLIGQATGRNKGKIARMLAAKAAISLRFDALAEDREDVATIGLDSRVQIESRLRGLEGREITTMRTPVNVRQQPKFEFATQRAYNIDVDAVTNGISKKNGKRKIEEIDSDEDDVPAAVEVAAADESDEEVVEEVEERRKGRKKGRKRKRKWKRRRRKIKRKRKKRKIKRRKSTKSTKHMRE
jgi:nucleolar protein 58